MTVTVNTPSKTYEVICASGAIAELIPTLERVARGSRIALLTDDKVDALHSERVCGMLEAGGVSYVKYVIKNGEAFKNPQTLFDFLEFMAESGIDRSDCILALGGGVVGDLAGFAASVYQRGIKFVQIPTTLLAMVDSSVGGKTAVDLKAGKNLAGTFYQPEAVICDTDFTATLDKRVFRDGCAEVIKYGVILDSELFNRLEGGIEGCLEYAVSRSVELKRDIVVSDERDNGIRAILNYGHTFGHAIESLSSFSVSHGEAVAKGMVLASKAASLLGIADLTERITAILHSYGFDLDCPYSAQQIAAAARKDKKRSGDSITLVLAESIGSCRLHKADITELESILGQIL